MPSITAIQPGTWQDLENDVAGILRECGMGVQQQVHMPLPRGAVNVDVLAEETHDGITQRIICECKNWRANVPREIVHAFRTVMQETGANRGYVISRHGFQIGAVEAAHATNIELLTYAEFQERYFTKWINKRCRDIEDAVGNFNVYYEPLGRPGFHLLKTDEERDAYVRTWNRFYFAGVMLMGFSPYLRMVGRDTPVPPLPYDVGPMEAHDIEIPEDIRQARGYREFLTLLENYAAEGLRELRAVNPLTRGKAPGEFVEELDAEMPPAQQ